MTRETEIGEPDEAAGTPVAPLYPGGAVHSGRVASGSAVPDPDDDLDDDLDNDRMAAAATVVLLRDGSDGLEVLLLERPRDRGSFAGAWVFPGGRIDAGDQRADDPADLAEEEIARRAAVREAHEETALELPLHSLVTTAVWTPPSAVPKRFRTWFFWAPAPGGEITLAADEIVDFAWMRPARALELHREGSLLLVPPTWITLRELSEFGSVAEALALARSRAVHAFATRLAAKARGSVLLWEGDVAYSDDALFDAPGGRNRLNFGTLPWNYSHWSDPALD